MIVFAIGFTASQSQAQEKNTEYERIKERKNKKNRRLKRRGDKGKSNKRKLRATKFKIRSKQGERAYQGDITGRKLKTKRSSRPNWGGKALSANPYAGRKRTTEASRAKALKQTPRYSSRKRERAWKGNVAGRANNRRSEKTTFIGKYKYQQAPGSDRSISRNPERPRKIKRIIPRSASGAYRVRRRKKPYAFRERSKWEKSYKGDITGRKFRAKGSSIKPILQGTPRIKYSSQNGRRGDRAYKGKIQAGYQSISRTKDRAWKKDISGHKLRIRTSKKPDFGGREFDPYPKTGRKGDRAYKGKLKGGGFKSVSSGKEKSGKRLSNSKPPGIGTARGRKFQGNIKAGRPLKGGGSISGKHWNNQGRAVQGRGPKTQDNRIAGFQGNVKGGKILKGGGSVGDRRWNNKGNPIQGRGPKTQDNRIAGFQGNIKGGKVLKGGGSISGQRWNNDGKAIQGRGPKSQDNRIAGFQGNIKGGKILKGGGSISGRLWNNKEKSITRREPNKQDNQVAGFQGNIKADRDNEKRGASKAANYKGSIKTYSYMTERGPDDEHIYTGGFKRDFKYKKNPNSADEALKVRKPDKKFFKTGEYLGNIKDTRKFKQNPSAAEESLMNRPPDRATAKGMKFQGRFKTKMDYKKRPGAVDEALKGIGPSRATIQASNFQGNIKMKNKRLGDRHPDYKYLSLKSNGKKEKEKFFSFKLLWSKLFKKEENQPDNLKEKPGKPRYDKGEEGLWNE